MFLLFCIRRKLLLLRGLFTMKHLIPGWEEVKYLLLLLLLLSSSSISSSLFFPIKIDPAGRYYCLNVKMKHHNTTLFPI